MSGMSESMSGELTGTKEHDSFANDVRGTSIVVGFPIERYAKPCSNVLQWRRRLATIVSSSDVSKRFRLETLASNQGCRK